MFEYPLTFKDENMHIAHIKNNVEFYQLVIDNIPQIKKLKTDKDEEIKLLNDKLQQMQSSKDRNRILEQELKEMKELLNDTQKLEELMKAKNGVSSVHKGECDEKYVEIVMKEVASENFRIDNSRGTNKMDIRLHRTDGSYTVGIECKDKKTITADDIRKFRSDKVKNKFHRSIFISTYPIKNIVDKDNNVLMRKDELFIVTKDPVFLGAVVKMYLSHIEKDHEGTNASTLVFESILKTYDTWQTSKKQLLKLDKAVLEMLKLHPDFTEKMKNNHLYMVTKSKTKENGVY